MYAKPKEKVEQKERWRNEENWMFEEGKEGKKREGRGGRLEVKGGEKEP